MGLNQYLQQTQRFCRDVKQDLLDPLDLIDYINRARREVAMRAQCIRVLTPISGSIVSSTLVDGGSGYTDNPTVTVSAPDFPSGQGPYPQGSQATATAIVNNGVIQSIDITYGGAGYYHPTITIEDSTGTGASATCNMSFINQLSQGQEVYNFSDVDLSAFPGVESVYMIKSVSLLYSNYRYSLPCYSFSTYQSQIRNYPNQYQWVSTFCAQYGQGTAGSFYLYPLPSQAYQLEWDCLCLPSDLIDDQSTEAIPMPWQDAVPYFAAHLAFLELQNYNSAKGMLELFDQYMKRYGTYTRPGRVTNPYGRF